MIRCHVYGEVSDTVPLKVVYIASSPRSGSTILERVLGQIPSVFAAGELRYVWERGFIKKQLCGCGKPVPECEIWSSVRKTFDSSLHQPHSPEGINSLLEEVMRLRNAYFRWLPSKVRSKSYPSERTNGFVHILDCLYRAVQKETGADVIIDSSKLVSYASLLMDVPDIEVHIVHLIRDSRAVVYSHQRIKERTEVVGETVYMDQIPWWKVSIFWLINNLSVSFLRRGNFKSITQVRYDSFIQNPHAIVAHILNQIGMAGVELDDIFEKENTAHLTANHTVAGNPGRFQTGEIVLKKDDTWELELNAATRRKVTLLTLPLLWIYHFTL